VSRQSQEEVLASLQVVALPADCSPALMVSVSAVEELRDLRAVHIPSFFSGRQLLAEAN